MNSNIRGDFQIYISVPLSKKLLTSGKIRYTKIWSACCSNFLMLIGIPTKFSDYSTVSMMFSKGWCAESISPLVLRCPNKPGAKMVQFYCCYSEILCLKIHSFSQKLIRAGWLEWLVCFNFKLLVKRQNVRILSWFVTKKLICAKKYMF